MLLYNRVKGNSVLTKTAVVLLLAGAVLSAASDADLRRARDLYSRTDYQRAIELLEPGASDGPAFDLIGRSYYMLADYKKAVEFLEKAVNADPTSSHFNLWLGKAYGRRAETSNPFSAPRLAGKARDSFQRAVQLDPKNLEAMGDLFEYYMEAPGFLGGGLDKAADIAAKIALADPVEGHFVRARLAEKRKEFGTAEDQLRRAVDLAPQQIGRLIDLAKFLAKQGRDAESEQTFAKAEKIAPASPKLLFERAQTYISKGKNLEMARTLLRRYLQSELTADDPPRSEAEKLLRQASGS